MPSFSLTERDREVVGTLTNRLRALALKQVADTWWAGSEQPAHRRLAQLADAGFVSLKTAPVQLLSPSTPLITWTPNQVEPEFGSVAYQLARRWLAQPTRHVVVSATREARTRFGSVGGRFPRRVELSHDLLLASVFLRLLADEPGTAETWKLDEAIYRTRIKRHNEKLPDAEVRRGGRVWVIEAGGKYPRDRLVAFHGYCVERERSYELW